VRIVVTILSILLAIMFVGVGTQKLLGAQSFVDGFAQFGFPQWFRIVVGAVEVIGGVLLLIPRLSWLGASAIAVVMIGATYTHLAIAPETASSAPVTVCLLLVTAFIAYMRRPRAITTTSAPVH
jgi:putative oxidoreductase